MHACTNTSNFPSGTYIQADPIPIPIEERPTTNSRENPNQRLIDTSRQPSGAQHNREGSATAGPITFKESALGDAKGRTRPGFKLVRAAKENQPELVKQEIDAQADINHVDEDQMSALMYAARNGNMAMVQTLIAAGADPGKWNASGETCMMLAASNGHKGIVALLLGKKFFIDENDRDGETALIKAAKNGHADVVELLLGHGAFPEASDNGGRTALMGAVSANCIETVTLLLQQGADVHGKDGDGYDALKWAAGQGKTEIVILLLKHEANPSNREKQGLDALMVAALHGHAGTIKVLVEHGASIEAKSTKGLDGVTKELNALMLACQHGHTDAVKMLLEKGANIDAESRSQSTPLILAALHGHIAVVQVLLDKGALAAINANDKSEQTALMAAALNGHADIVKLLLEKGANIEAENKYGWNALMLAAKCGHIETVKELLQLASKAFIDRAKPDGFTALMLAALNGNTAVVELLLNHGADLDAVDRNSNTALMHAASRGKYESAMSLMKHIGGVDVCLSAAFNQGNQDLIQCIAHVLANAPNYHPRMAGTMIVHAIVDLKMNRVAIKSMVEGGLIPSKADRKTLMENPKVRDVVKKSFNLKPNNSEALLLAEYQAGDYPQADRLIDAPDPSANNLLGVRQRATMAHLPNGHATDSGGKYLHALRQWRIKDSFRPAGSAVKSMLDQGWRSVVIAQVDQAEREADRSVREITSLFSHQSNGLSLTGKDGRQVDVSDVAMNDTLFAFALGHNEHLNQLAYPANMVPPSSANDLDPGSHAQAKAILELNKTYTPLTMKLSGLARARQLEDAVKKNRQTREVALDEVGGLVEQAKGLFNEGTSLKSDVARHWWITGMNNILEELDGIRSGLEMPVLQ